MIAFFVNITGNVQDINSNLDEKEKESLIFSHVRQSYLAANIISGCFIFNFIDWICYGFNLYNDFNGQVMS